MSGVTDTSLTRLLRIWADDAVAFARVLAQEDPSLGAEHFALAGGRAVLCGPGMYVNRVLAAGLGPAMTDADLDLLEQRCAIVGVRPEVEVSRLTHPATVGRLAARGYLAGDVVVALARQLADVDDLPPGDPTLSVERADGDLLPMWQETSALGWGHATEERRRASDAFARAAAVVDGEHLVVVRDADDRRAVACASMSIRDGVATLGGMSTVPGERGRGIQSALIAHRLRAAASAGCDLAASTTAPDSGSERNMRRLGFRRCCSLVTWSRSTPRR